MNARMLGDDALNPSQAIGDALHDLERLAEAQRDHEHTWASSLAWGLGLAALISTSAANHGRESYSTSYLRACDVLREFYECADKMREARCVVARRPLRGAS